MHHPHLQVKIKTNTMTTEELLKPRYKVIADYPDSICRIGDILEIVSGKFEIWTNIRSGSLIKKSIPSFPAIFKKLEWWEERDEKDMPEYLKFEWNGKTQEVYKVKDWLFGNSYQDEKNKQGGIQAFTHYSFAFGEPFYPRVSIIGMLPISKEEYEQYQNQNLLHNTH